MMRVLVTGATGFVGGAVARRLAAAGNEVLATGRDRSTGEALAAEGIRFLPADLTEAEVVYGLCEGVDRVVHSAALSSPWGRWEDFFAANVTATRNVLTGSLLAGVKRFVHISTPGTYATGRDRFDLGEDAPLSRPMNHYIATKRLAEGAVREAEAAGLETIILRPRAIIGPGDRVILPRIVRALEAGRLPRIGRRRVLADLTVIDNVVLAVELALDSATHGGVYNITNGESLPLWDLVEEVCTRLELPRPRRRLPYRFVWLVAFGLEILHRLQPSRGEPIMTRYGVSLLGRSLTLDISAARRDLGYEPTVSVAEGTDRFIAWWRERS